MLAEWVVYIKYIYQKGLFGTNERAEATICVKAESERAAAEKARRQLQDDLKQKGCRLVNYSTTVKKM